MASPADAFRDAWRRARAAQPQWAARPLAERILVVRRARDHLAAHADEWAATISRENGKTRLDALATEILPAVMAADYYVRQARRFLRTRRLGASSIALANKVSRIRRVPWGVIGIISPWNYPFAIPFSEVVMALLAGNAVALKVARRTPLAGRALLRCFQAAGLPGELLISVDLPGPVAAGAMLEAGVDKLFFTGSVEAGRQLAVQAAATLTPVCLELGGNDPMLVCPDADLERAANGALWAGMQNCGQSCGGVERIYVQREAYPRFLELLAEKVRALRVGPDADHEVEMGAMTTDRQRDQVQEHVREALAQGARLFAVSPCPEPPGNFLPAMVLTQVDHTMRVMREETFGPVVGVMAVADMDEAVRLANDSDLGLTASVWSRDRRTARRLACRLQAGVVTINDHLMSHGLAETPWGGFKRSGLGRTHGEIGFAEMTQPQCLVDDCLPGLKRQLWWYPHGPAVYEGIRGLLDMLYARGISRRLAGARRMLRILPRMFKSGNA